MAKVTQGTSGNMLFAVFVYTHCRIVPRAWLTHFICMATAVVSIYIYHHDLSVVRVSRRSDPFFVELRFQSAVCILCRNAYICNGKRLLQFFVHYFLHQLMSLSANQTDKKILLIRFCFQGGAGCCLSPHGVWKGWMLREYSEKESAIM